MRDVLVDDGDPLVIDRDDERVAELDARANRAHADGTPERLLGQFGRSQV